jgi:hypothetical protein
MRNLEKRFEKLEQEYKPAEIIVIMVTHWGGELKGWEGDGFYIARLPVRAKKIYKSAHLKKLRHTPKRTQPWCVTDSLSCTWTLSASPTSDPNRSPIL